MLTIRYGGEENKMMKGIDSLQFNNYSAYNRINNPVDNAGLKKLSEEAAQAPKQEERAEVRDLDLRLDDIKPRQNASLEDISLSLNEPSGFEMKGRDSDILSLDMEKAVSDMQKDQALMQYQYFVGDTNLLGSEDGIVIAK